MAFSMAGGGPSGPQINVTPLIDVLLTLIVVFMIVVAMEQDQGEMVQIPQPQTRQTPAQRQSRTIVIQLVWTAKDQPTDVVDLARHAGVQRVGLLTKERELVGE